MRLFSVDHTRLSVCFHDRDMRLPDIAGNVVTDILVQEPLSRTPVVRRLSHMDNLQIAHHIALLKNEDTNVRYSAAEALGQSGDASAVPALVEALKDENSDVRDSVAKVLAENGR
jgi:HEAT repeat protein